MVATTCEKRPDGFFSVPLNIRCSRKWARPDLPGVSSAAPTLYQTMWVTTGARRSGTTTTSRPFESVKCPTSGFGAACAPKAKRLAATAKPATAWELREKVRLIGNAVSRGLRCGSAAERLLRQDNDADCRRRCSIRRRVLLYNLVLVDHRRDPLVPANAVRLGRRGRPVSGRRLGQ